MAPMQPKDAKNEGLSRKRLDGGGEVALSMLCPWGEASHNLSRPGVAPRPDTAR
jgi:hypothetical protein